MAWATEEQHKCAIIKLDNSKRKSKNNQCIAVIQNRKIIHVQDIKNNLMSQNIRMRLRKDVTHINGTH